MYVDPSGHVWKSSDKKYNDDAQAKIIALTTAELNAKTTAEKKALQKQQETIRKSPNSAKSIDKLIEINDKKQEAYYKQIDKALSNDKLSKKELYSSLKSLGATTNIYQNYNSNANGYKTSSINVNVKINKNVKVNVYASSSQNNKKTDIVSSYSSIKATTHYSAYVFYLPEWKGEMRDATKTISSYYGISEDDIGTASVTNEYNLSRSWNMLGSTASGSNISAVVIDTHADDHSLDFSSDYSISTSEISNLNNKNIDNLILYGCNAGHLD